MKRSNTGRRLTLAVVYAISLAVVWGIAVAWLIETVVSPNTRQSVYENLHVAIDGTPVIASNSQVPPFDVSLRTLDNQTLDSRDQNWLTGGTIIWNDPSNQPREPIGWGQRILAAADGGRPATYWYLIRNVDEVGQAYFVGYDSFSKRRIGFLSKSGFRAALPSRDDWFDVGQSSRFQFGAACSRLYLAVGVPSNYSLPSDDSTIPRQMVYVIDSNRVVEVDLRRRQARTVFESADPPRCVTIVGLPVAVDESRDEPPAENAASTNRLRVHPASFQQSDDEQDADEFTEIKWDTKETHRLAVVTQDAISIVDPVEDTVEEFPIAADTLGETVGLYLVRPDQLLLTKQFANRRGVQLQWVGRSGEIERERSVDLQNWGSPSERSQAWQSSVIAPLPLGWLTGCVIAPAVEVYFGQADSYGQSAQKILRMMGPMLLTVVAVGAALAWIASRGQRRCYRPATAAWCGFVFLFGPMGLVAYWLAHRRPPLVACGECHRQVPRDRADCAACGSEFPPPAMVGTEIFD